MAGLNDNGNIIVSDHILIKDLDTNEVIINTRGHSNNSNQIINNNISDKNEDKK